MTVQLLSEEQVKHKIGISNWKELSKEKFFEFLKLSPQIDKEVHMKILEQVPNYVELANQISQNILVLAEQKKEITSQTLSILKAISESLTDLAKKEFLTPEERNSVLDRLMEMVRIVEKIEERHGGFIKDMVMVIGGIGAFALAVVAVVFGVQKKT